MIGFDFQPRTRVVFGPGSVDRLGELAREVLQLRIADVGRAASVIRDPQLERAASPRVLLVTDPGIVAAGHVERACRSLAAAGVETRVFDQVRENPTTRDVEACLAVAREAEIDLIVGLGGGSSMDTAKGCNFLLTNGGRMQDYWGIGKATRPMLPLIAVPTTAGTGSECQSFALIADEETHRKMACGDPKAAPRVALLDPELTLSQPREVTACTGIDALAHAVETAVTRRRNELSGLYSREAFRLIVHSLERVLEQPDDLEARARMQLGAAYAGMAIEQSMLGAAHAAANPLTARFGTAHGHAVGLMLPHVIRLNAADPDARAAYAELATLSAFGARRSALGNVKSDNRPAVDLALTGRRAPSAERPSVATDFLADRCAALVRAAFGSPVLHETGDIPALSREAAEQWTARYNPRPVTAAEFEELYRKVLA